MKSKPVRICDVSRILRISSASLISFLQENGYSIIGDYRSPLSSRMVELIQNGYNEGPPFLELTPLMPQAEAWEIGNQELVKKLHAPARPRAKEIEEPEERGPYYRKPRKPYRRARVLPAVSTYTGRIALTYMDMELIQRILALEEPEKIQIRDYLRRKTLLKAISQLE